MKYGYATVTQTFLEFKLMLNSHSLLIILQFRATF